MDEGKNYFMKNNYDFEKYKIAFHGTTETKMRDVMINGFDGNGRWIMLAEQREEAIRYANSYCSKLIDNKIIRNDYPVVLTVDLSDFNILSNDYYQNKLMGDFRVAQKLSSEGNFDGMLSDSNAGYFVIFNIIKLNSSIKSGKSIFNVI